MKPKSNALLSMLLAMPTFGYDNDMKQSTPPPIPTYSSNKPSKKRSKNKAAKKSRKTNRKK